MFAVSGEVCTYYVLDDAIPSLMVVGISCTSWCRLLLPFSLPKYLIDGVEPMEYFVVDSSMKISRPASSLYFLCGATSSQAGIRKLLWASMRGRQRLDGQPSIFGSRLLDGAVINGVCTGQQAIGFISVLPFVGPTPGG